MKVNHVEFSGIWQVSRLLNILDVFPKVMRFWLKLFITSDYPNLKPSVRVLTSVTIFMDEKLRFGQTY